MAPAATTTMPMKITRRKRRSFVSRFTPTVNRRIGRVLKVAAVVAGTVLVVKKKSAIGNFIGKGFSLAGKHFFEGATGGAGKVLGDLGTTLQAPKIIEDANKVFGAPIRDRSRAGLRREQARTRAAAARLPIVPDNFFSRILDFLFGSDLRTPAQKRQVSERRRDRETRERRRIALSRPLSPAARPFLAEIGRANERAGAAILAGMVGR